MVKDGMTVPLCSRKSRVENGFGSAIAVIISAHLAGRDTSARAPPKRKGVHAPRRTVTARLPSQHRDHAVSEGEALGHDGDEIGQQFLAQRRIVLLDRLELLDSQHVKGAGYLGPDRGAARGTRNEAHLAARRVAAETSHPRAATLTGGNHDPDAAVENEMHRIGGIAGADDNLAGLDLEALAAMDQFHGVAFSTQYLGKPFAQAGLLALQALVLDDDLVLAPLERVIQFGHDVHLARNELARSQRLFGRGRQMHQYQLDAQIMRGPLDLGKTVSSRRIDAGDELEIEDQETAFRMSRQKRLDALVKPVGGAKKQIALQVQALNLSPGRGEHRLIVACPVERTAIFGAVEAVFDGID